LRLLNECIEFPGKVCLHRTEALHDAGWRVASSFVKLSSGRAMRLFFENDTCSLPKVAALSEVGKKSATQTCGLHRQGASSDLGPGILRSMAIATRILEN